MKMKLTELSQILFGSENLQLYQDFHFISFFKKKQTKEGSVILQ